ncbi:MAG: type II secretion system F family protein [Candidatus Firestonebacteria bacterium]|nr:type II secretion system F family protein [Candidatus Firestonebacteria bacterium]
MPIFTYSAVDSDGKDYKGDIEAESKAVAITKLQRQRLMIVSIKRKWALTKLLSMDISGGKISQDDILLFSRQLAALVKARIPIEQCLDVLINQIGNPALKKIIKNVRNDVISGMPLSVAMAKYPKCFDNLYVGMLKAGEVSGKLPEILVRTAKYMDRTSRLRNKVKSAMIYPTLVICVGIMAVIFILTVVIPQFEKMYSTMGGDLPLLTKVMIYISRDILQKYLVTFPYNLFSILIISTGIYLLLKVVRSEKGRFRVDETLLKVPVLGAYLSKVIFAKFSQTLGILVSNGVPILESMDLVSKTVGSKPVEKAILAAKEKIKEGEKIADTLKKSAYFPALVISMVNVGEQTGKLGEVLEQLAEFYDEEVEISTAAITALIEPLLIIALAGIVALIVMALYLPVFKMTGGMGKMQGNIR